MCDAAVASGAHSASGRVLFAKNSDRKLGECQPFVQFSAAHYSPGSELQCTHISISQVAQTHRVMGHAPWWVWGFEHGVNEHGLVVGNLAVFSRESPEEKPGLIGMDLVRLGLERSANARAAIDVITGLLETHGQGGAALAPGGSGYHNSFLLADASEAWILETSGRRWAMRPAQLDALSNHLCLGADWSAASEDLESFARAEGWWSDPGRVAVAGAYRNEHVPGRISDGRQSRSLELLQQGAGKHDVASMQALLRDHLEGGMAPPAGATVEDDRFYTLCMHSEPIGTTTASLVAEIDPEPAAISPVWISFGTPCTGIFLPIYIDGVIPAALASGSERETEASAWWSFARLQAAASGDFSRYTPVVREGFKTLETKIEAERLRVEAAAGEASTAGDLDEASRQLTTFMEQIVEEALTTAGTLREAIS